MIKVYIEFLKCILELIKLTYERENYEAKDEKEVYICLFEQKVKMGIIIYQNIKSQKCEDDFLNYIKSEYSDDMEMYLSLLTYIYGIVGDVKIEVRYMEEIFENGIRNNEDVFMMFNLDMQIRYISWTNNYDISFEKQWNRNYILGEKIRESIGFHRERIPTTDRNKNTIVVITSQILDDKHAPTRLALDTCYRMIKLLNKDVLLINFAQYTNEHKLQKAGLNFITVMNYNEDYNGQSEYEYKDLLIPMYQVAFDESRLHEIKSVLEFIYSLKPYCIWNIATLPGILPTLNQITTNIYTPCGRGYAPVKTDIIYNYFSNTDENSHKNKAFLKKHGIQIVDYFFIRKRKEKNVEIKREDIGIPNDSFVICVAGNRLEFEIDDVFLRIMNTIIESNQQVHLMFIGTVSDEFIRKCEYVIKNTFKIHFLGYRDDFLECMSLMDLYVNTFGVGGGTAGNNALFLGKPVLTLNKGDIYSFVGDNFATNAIEEYIPLINRYIDDKDFYESQSRIARERYENLSADDEKVATVLQEILDKIK